MSEESVFEGQQAALKVAGVELKMVRHLKAGVTNLVDISVVVKAADPEVALMTLAAKNTEGTLDCYVAWFTKEQAKELAGSLLEFVNGKTT